MAWVVGARLKLPRLSSSRQAGLEAQARGCREIEVGTMVETLAGTLPGVLTDDGPDCSDGASCSEFVRRGHTRFYAARGAAARLAIAGIIATSARHDTWRPADHERLTVAVSPGGPRGARAWVAFRF